MKSIKCDVKIVNSNLLHIALPSYSKNDLVSVAKIKLGLQTMGNHSIKVSYSSYKDDKQISAWDNVNSYSNIETGKLYTLDITDEIRDAMDNSADKIILTFNNAQSITLPNYLLEQVFEYEYVLKDDYNYSNNHSFDLNLAGSGTINLATGELSLSHSDVSTNFVLPMNIVHTYNNSKNQNEYLSESYQKLTKTHTGKGFKLNVQQYLIKEQNEDGDLQFTYIDAQGKNHYFTEKYYYLSDDNEKIYVKRENLNLNPDGSYYIIVDGAVHNVDTKLETDTGFTLVSSIAGLNGSNLVDYEPEELANVRQTLKSLKENRIKYEQNLEDLKYQFTLTALNKINTINKNETGNISSDITSDANKLSTLISEYVDLYNKNCSRDEIFSSEHLESIKNYLLSKSKVYPQYKTILNAKNESVNVLNTQTYSCAYTDEKQIEDIVKNICEYYFNLQTINEQITKYEYQLKLLELQVPMHYLYNHEQLILGFGKTYELVTEEEQNSSNSNNNQNNQKPDMEIQTDNTTKYNETDVYRLILVTDSYENTIFISYDELDSSKILGIADADNNNIVFNYNDNDLLSEIVDSKERKILFNYSSNNQLTKITHQNGEIIRYFYVDNHPTYVIDESTGLGVKFEYTNEKVTKISSLSILNNVKNGQITFNFDYNGENATSETLASLEQQEGFLIENESISFNYYDYKSTTLTDAKGNSETYVLDKYGKTKCVYENVFNENSSSIIVYAKEFNYTNDKVSENISALPYSKNYLNNACFDVLAMSTEYGYYLGDDIYLGEEAIPYSYQICKNYHTMPENETVCSVSVSSESVAEINNNITSLILSGWAKADSAFVFDVEERSGEDYTNASSEIQNRRFDISAEITYSDGSKQKFSKSFDWMNTEWQYCSLAITIDKDKTLTSILCFVDYTNNTGTIQFTDLELKEGSWSKTEYNSEKQPIKTYSSHSDVITTYTYDNNKLIKEISTHNNLEYVTTYEYDNYGKLLRKIDYNGIVSENVYNDKGICIKTKTYHKDDPTTVIYQESELDEKGNLTGELNSLGDKIGSYSYDKSGLVISYSDSAGNKTAYGYDNSDSLISMTSSINGEKNSNIFGYTGNYLTALKHNGFEINYEYDYLGRAKTALISGNEFVSKSYSECEETTNLANGATFRQEYNKKGSPLNLYYKQNADSAEVICAENIYDTNNNVVLTKEYIDGNISTSTKYTYDKFGKLAELMSNQNNAYWGIVNTYGETEDTTKITISSKDLLYTYKYNNDLDKKLNTIILPNGKQQCIKYDKLGRTNEIKLGDHIKQFHYLSSGDHTSNLISSVWYGDNTKLNENYRYRYDEKGNIIEIKENGTLIVRYLYDSLSRLIREDNKLLGFTTAFSYDNGGNIINKQMYNFTLNEKLDSETILSSIPYYYNSTGWRDQLVSYNGETFAYDELGNPTKYRDKNLTWSHGRLLKSLGSHTFQYNSNGIRIKKDNIKYFIDGNKVWCQTDGTNTMYFHYGIDGIIGFEYKDKEYTYKKNIQGDIIGIYNPENKLICKYIYDAWGNHDIYILNESNEISSYKTVDKSNNTEYTDICNLNPFRYRGYYYDTETDLYYLNSRYYDPELGRFINADAIDNINMNLINGLNLYTYCSNNPMMFTDSKGSNWLSDLWNKTKKFFKENWDVIVGTITSIALVAGGLAVTIFSGGTLSWLGATMLGAGVGGFIGGLQSKLDGGSYWGGYLGGAISGGLTGLGASIGPITAFFAGFLGNLSGTLITDVINGNFINNKNYWLNLTGDSLISGLIAISSYGVGNLINIYNVPGFKDIFIALTVCAEFISSYIFDTSKTYIKDILYYIHRYGIFW